MAQMTLQTSSLLVRATRSFSREVATPSTSLAVGRIQTQSSSQRTLSTSSSASLSYRERYSSSRGSAGSWSSRPGQSGSSWRRDQHQLLFAGPNAAGSGRTSAGRRAFSNSAIRLHGGKGRPAPGTGIKVTFMNSKGEEIKTVEGNEGDDIVDLSWEYDLDIEAACEKSIACSTCHVILDGDSFDKLEEPSDEENDMLDMAFGLEDTSRLGCQVKLTRDLDGMTVKLPSATRNFAVDGHKSKH